MLDITPQIGRDTLQPADGDGLTVYPFAPARRLARPVARASENARKYVRLPVEHVCICVPALRNQPDVFRYVGMRRAGPLAIHYLMKVVWIADIRGLQELLPSWL